MLPLILLTFLVGPTAAQRPPDVRVYVFTAPSVSGFADQLLLDRQDAVKQLAAQIEKQKALTVVDDPDRADLQVEVVGALKKDMGRERTTPAILGPGTNTRKVKDHALHAAIRVGDYKLEIEGTHRVEKQAVGAVADAVETWVKQNAEKLGTAPR
jgi:hypothetical protein